ncbi:MAG: hypothetical protein WCZ25_12285 [Aminobacteriaceae bacterium]|jgi:hypothetical protein|nr:hypothetical protein [Synergistaceae bacterium]MDD4021350.1 hypothetical protein [Synergistaceae bacterium]
MAIMSGTAFETAEKCSRLPEMLRPLFWDADWNCVDFQRNRTAIIERVLNLGNEEQLAWLLKNVAEEEILSVVSSSRRLSRKTARCWQNYFGLKEEEMKCFGMFSTNPDNLF